MIGAILGDMVGSVHEFKKPATKEKNFGDLFIDESSFSDDTVCTIAIAEWLVDPEKRGVDFHLRKYGKMYPDKGYGKLYTDWLDDPEMGPYNSWGNGAPMRVSPVGHYATSLRQAYLLAKQSAEVTHDHPQGIKGAQFVAGFIYLARCGTIGSGTLEEIVDRLIEDLDEDGHYKEIINSTLDDIRPEYKFMVSAKNTVPQAVRCVLEAKNFEDAIRNAISLGGDADTLAAIVGSMAEVVFEVPDDLVQESLRRLDTTLRLALFNFYNILVKLENEDDSTQGSD